MRKPPENRRKTGLQNPIAGSAASRWQKGCSSPNPGGRPKTAPLSQACRELLARPLPHDSEDRTYAEAIAQTLAQKALEGDIRAAQEIADRAEGRTRQSIEIQSVALREAFERMSREELEAYAREGALPAWFPRTESTNYEPIQ